MKENYSRKICKNRGKTSVVEFNFSIIVGQTSEAVINKELFLNVVLGNLQKFFQKCFKNNTYEQLILELASKILLSLTISDKPSLKSVSFSLSESVSHNSTFIFATAVISRFGLSFSITAVFWVWALLCALSLQRFQIEYGNWLQSYHRGMEVSVSSSRFQPDNNGSHFGMSLVSHTMHPIICLNICPFNALS